MVYIILHQDKYSPVEVEKVFTKERSAIEYLEKIKEERGEEVIRAYDDLLELEDEEWYRIETGKLDDK